MTKASLRHLRSPRVLFVTLALALASTSAASANVLTPLEATGGPGGGGFGGSMMIEELGLVPTNNGGGFATLEDGPATASYEDLLARSGGAADASAITGVAPAEMPTAGPAADTPGGVATGPERETETQADERELELAKAAAEEAAEWPEFDSIAIGEQARSGGAADASAITGVAPAEMPTAGLAADTPVLVGSGPEHETVAQADERELEQAPQATSPHQRNF